MRNPMSRVRGLGSAKEGVEHWWVLRITSVALVPLVIWYVISLISLVGADRDAVVEWLRSPFAAIASVLLIVVTFHHAQLGAQVVIEDYVHKPWQKNALLLISKFAAAVLGATAVFAVLKIAFS